MSKLVWSRASFSVFDPARYMHRDDFVTPDDPVVSRKRKKRRKPLTPEQKRKRIAQKNALDEAQRAKAVRAKARAASRHKEQAEAKAARRALAQEQQAQARERKRIKIAKRKLKEAEKAQARRAAFEAYRKTPEYAEKLAKDKAKTAELKKTHLQAWVERDTALREDRQVLRSKWRSNLLRRAEEPE